MAFSFGNAATSNNNNQQQQAANSFSFGTPQTNTNAPTSFSFGTPATQTQAQEQPKPSFSFGINTNTATPANNSIFSFGGQNNSTQPSGGGLFGQTPQNQNTGGTGLFGQTNTNNQQQQSSNLFGQAAQPSSQNTGTGLFGQASSTTTSNNFFGNNNAQNNTTTSNLFGRSTNQSAQPTFGNLFGSTAQPNLNMSTNTFNTNNQNPQQQSFAEQQQQQQPKPQPTLAQSVYGQTLSQPQFSWSRSAQLIAQPTMPSFNLSSSVLAPAPAPSNSNHPNSNLTQSITLPHSNYGPLQPASIQDQLVRLKNAWDPTHSDCIFQAYFYNRVAPETASLYTKPDDHKQSAWDEAVAARPDNSVVPVLARGFNDLQARLDAQQQQINIYRTRMHEIADKLKELNDRHLLHATPKTDAARRNHMQLTRRSLQLATKVQVLKCRGYALRPEEEQLRARLQTLESQLKDPTTFGRIDEIWAKMTLLRQKKKSAEEEIKARGYTSHIEFEEGDGLEVLGQVLRDLNNGLQHVSGVVKTHLNKINEQIEKYKVTHANQDKSRPR